MTGIVHKSFDSADETRPFEDGKGKLQLVTTAHGPVGRAVFEPGWQWSKHVAPLAGTKSCEAAHAGYVVSGRMKIVMDDGETDEAGIRRVLRRRTRPRRMGARRRALCRDRLGRLRRVRQACLTCTSADVGGA